MRKLIIHIGTPKTGSTAIQRYALGRQPYLASNGFDFLPRRRRGSYNDLAVLIRGKRLEEAAPICTDIRTRIADSPADNLILTSEMFAGCDPALLREALTLEEQFDVRIIGYFRRQDRFLESAYKQKLKTGKVKLGFENYLKKFGTNGGKYLRIVNWWQDAWPEARFIFRRFEPRDFVKNDVVHDFMGCLGLDIDADDKPPTAITANPTPSIDVLDLMQIVAAQPGLDARKVFRNMPIPDLPRFTGRAMDNQSALNLLTQFAEDNEVLRQRFFPQDPVLFRCDDLDGPEPDVATPSLTDEQRLLIRSMLKAAMDTTLGKA